MKIYSIKKWPTRLSSTLYILKKHYIIFIKEFHLISMYRYQRIVKIYKKFKRYFDFLKVKAIVIIVIRDYEVYIKMKTLQYKLYKKV